jgi:uncharacterized Zn-binding protein involved in type VI secretion
MGKDDSGPIIEGSADVFIGGMPAARVGDRLRCKGTFDTIAEGDPSVFINGRPAACTGDKTARGGVIIGGSGSVFIGISKQARCAKQAAIAGSPFVVMAK